jgi:LEA14-like dessication related protein
LETAVILALVAVAWFAFEKGSVVANLKFIENGVSFDLGNPLRPIINLSVLVQNPTSGTITLQSLAGYFFINGIQGGNVSNFQGPIVIGPNIQTSINLALSVNDLSLMSIVQQFAANGTGALNIAVQATANIDNVPTPVNLSFNPTL